MKNPIANTCQHCNEVFFSKPYDRYKKAFLERKFCSRKCCAYSKKNTKMSEEQKKLISISKKGCATWNKGKNGVYSQEVLQKMSESKMGKLLGEKNPNWKGGISSINKIERDRFSKHVHGQVLERDDYTCQMCGVRGVALQVDHIQSWAEYVELRFDINNCRTLCESCHYQITFKKPMPINVKTWGRNLIQGAIYV